jgi:CheY-like chemotaxis protein
VMQEYWDPIRSRLTVEELDGSFALRANLQGLIVEELRVRVHDDTVTISGSSRAEGEQRPFCRTVRLPAAVRSDRIRGGFEQGILNLSLPAAASGRPRWSTTLPALPRQESERRVLVVDDDADVRHAITATLADEGYEVLAAPHGAAALDLISQAPPRAILLDMRMPVMDGWEFSRTYRRLPGPHAPIIAVTAATDAAARAAQIDADGYLAKPFEVNEMLAVVGRHARA